MTFATQQRNVARAMSDQLTRVNRTPSQRETDRRNEDISRYMRRIVDLEKEIARLERELAAARNPAIRPGSPPPGYTPTEPRRSGRPVLTVPQAAKRAGLSRSQVTRYCQSGHWAAERDESGRWWIYSDQSLTRRTRRKQK